MKFRLAAAVALASLLATLFSSEHALLAQQPQVNAAAQIAAPDTFDGILGIVWGDPHPISGTASEIRYTLTQADGSMLLLQMTGQEKEAVLHFGKRVIVTGRAVQAQAVAAPGATQTQRAVVVDSIESGMTFQADPQASVLGTRSVIFLLVKFSDDAARPDPHPANFYTDMTNPDTPPGGSQFPSTLNGFFKKTSYNQFSWTAAVGGAGGLGAPGGWLTLPHPKSYYAPCGWSSSCANLNLLADEATALGRAQGINFKVYNNINFVLSNDLDCCAWGGGYFSSVDGQSYGATWEPPWGQIVPTYGHEMGHSIGLPHSGWAYYAYDSPWDVMSSIQTVSQTLCGSYFSANDGHTDSVYCSEPGDGYIGPHKDFLGWIPAANEVVTDTNSSTTVTLEGSSLPLSSAVKLIKICIAGSPCTGSTAHYYTVEARVKGLGVPSQFDNGIPNEGIVIHDVQFGRAAISGPCYFNSQSGWAVPVDSTPGDYDSTPGVCNSGGRGYPNYALYNAQFAPGQSYTNALFKVNVVSRSGSTFVVSVTSRTVMSGVTLTPNKVAPQLTGTTVTFTAAGAGGVVPYAYKFILTTNNWASYTVVQDWSASATWTWTPATPNASYQVGVGARSAWDTADAWEAAAAVSFPITSPAVLTVAVQGSGSVTTGDGFITCPAVTCSHSYTGLTTVTLQATPAMGFVFAGWSSSACSSGAAAVIGNLTCGATFLPSATPRRGTVNLSGAGLGDVFTYDPVTGAYTEQFSDGLGHFGEIRGTWPAGLQVYPADFNNDGRTDFLVYSPVSGAWSQAINTGAGSFTYVGGSWPTGLQMYLVDLNGDSRTDLFAYNPVTGLWSRCLTPGVGTGFTCTSGTWPTGVSLYPADFNADGLADFFAYNASTGVWSLAINNGTLFNYSNGTWPTGLTLLPGDFNGDGRSDFFVSNPATGAWSVATTQANLTFTYMSGTWSVGWTFVPGDFNGDGKTDLFLFQPAQGWWNEAISNGLASVFTLTPGTWSAGWQLQVTDLNGDGQSDALLYSPTSGVWYQALHTGAGTFTYTTGTWSPGLTVIGSVPKIP
jgi:M6 family metalloprotease-like protein